MGQALMRLAPGIFLKPTYRTMALKLIQSGDSFSEFLSILSDEIGVTASGERSDQSKGKEASIIEECYMKYLYGADKGMNLADFYQAVCKTIEEINKNINSTQFCVPTKEKLKEVYESHYHGQNETMSKEEFQKVLQELIMHSGFTGFGSKDTLLFIFGVPAAALFIKQRLAPKAIPNDVFIPSVTSATVYLLARLNKI